ncbi:MAG: winged helix-turn-helix transcriptional regulator [Candidatus Bathyarchaeota archaeon]|nr:winged helix-turn-helix transcriptional regulator [Candidatus Bathyarchaeota archaeon]MDH5787139.1 winged helix-turn-helix transcriptional regulator [Candidatus Bathyarchaeota archaeon]
MKGQKLLELLKVMMKNSRLSDREIGRRLKYSQPTVTRSRTFLEKQGFVKSYTVVPNFGKVGYKILAFTFSSLKSYPSQEKAAEIVQKSKKWLKKHPNVIYAADGQGLGGRDVVMVSFHKDYDDYTKFMHDYAFNWGDIVSSFESFITNLTSELVMREFDLSHLADHI